MLKEGEKAPDLSGLGHKGEPISLASLWKEGALVLFFYPKDFTPVCTKEACLFRDIHAELAEQGVQVVGISADSPESHQRFAKEHTLLNPLLSDEDRTISKAFGIMRPFGMGAKRVTFVIDKVGTIRGVFHHELSAGKHLDGVKDALASL